MASTSKQESTRLVTSPSKGTRQKRVHVTICSGSPSSTVKGLMQHIRQHCNDVVYMVRYVQLPYNISDMNEFDLSGVDVLLLCHSIDNRRFSITNVTDALYDSFLPKVKNYLGKSKVGVIAHDFPKDVEQSSKMDSFRCTQPTTFKCASLVLIGGQLTSDPVDLDNVQLSELRQFFSQTQTWTEYIKVKLYRFFHIITCGIFA